MGTVIQMDQFLKAVETIKEKYGHNIVEVYVDVYESLVFRMIDKEIVLDVNNNCKIFDR